MSRNATKGFSIIEIIISIGIAAVIIVVSGNVFAAMQKINGRSERKDIAGAYAKEYIEILSSIQSQSFGCSCATETCTATTCTRASDSQSCTLRQGYQSCWTQFPKNVAVNSPLFITQVAGAWTLQQGSETISNTIPFTRSVQIENLKRDANGNLSDAGAVDTNSKKITAIVSWNEGGSLTQLSLPIIITLWKQ